MLRLGSAKAWERMLCLFGLGGRKRIRGAGDMGWWVMTWPEGCQDWGGLRGGGKEGGGKERKCGGRWFWSLVIGRVVGVVGGDLWAGWEGVEVGSEWSGGTEEGGSVAGGVDEWVCADDKSSAVRGGSSE